MNANVKGCARIWSGQIKTVSLGPIIYQSFSLKQAASREGAPMEDFQSMPRSTLLPLSCGTITSRGDIG